LHLNSFCSGSFASSGAPLASQMIDMEIIRTEKPKTNKAAPGKETVHRDSPWG